jgi:hypothetical protein
MARYSSAVTSAAALADDTGFAWLMGVAAAGGKLRRVVCGVRHTTAATAVTDMQCKIGIARVTSDGTGALTAATVNKLDLRHPTASLRSGTAWATSPPTVGAEATDIFPIPFNAKSGVDIPAEFLEEFWINNVVTDGFAFMNRSGVLPASHVFELLYEWEE